MVEIKLYKSRQKAIRLIILCLPLVFASLYLIIYNHSDKTLEWICLCFFGLGIPLGIFNLLDKRPQIIMNEVGIFDRIAYKELINWDWIKDAYLKEARILWVVQKQHYICLVLNQDVIPNSPRYEMLKKTFPVDLGFQQVNILLDQLKKINGQKFTDFIKKMSCADAETKQNLLLTPDL
jgi:hypothetical protein